MKPLYSDPMRTFAMPGESDASWADRSATSKAVMLMRHISSRLEGLSEALQNVALLAQFHGGRDAEMFGFFALSVRDMADGLARSHALLWAEYSAADSVETPTKAKKRKGKVA